MFKSLPWISIRADSISARAKYSSQEFEGLYKQNERASHDTKDVLWAQAVNINGWGEYVYVCVCVLIEVTL